MWSEESLGFKQVVARERWLREEKLENGNVSLGSGKEKV
jgi:hypothetical protein